MFHNHNDFTFKAPHPVDKKRPREENETPTVRPAASTTHPSSTHGMTALLHASEEARLYGSPAKKISSTSLHDAVETNNHRSLLLLFRNKREVFLAHLNSLDYYGNTPLHIAIMKVNVRAFNLLIEAGADTTLPNCAGQTPLKLAEIICRFGKRNATDETEEILAQAQSILDKLLQMEGQRFIKALHRNREEPKTMTTHENRTMSVILNNPFVNFNPAPSGIDLATIYDAQIMMRKMGFKK